MEKSFRLFFLSGLIFLSFLSNSMAVSLTSAGNVSIGTSSPSTIPDNFKFKIIALDALTHGAVTNNTNQISFGVILNNDTANSYPQVNVSINNIQLQNSNGSSDSFTGNSANVLTFYGAAPFSSLVKTAIPSPLTVVSLKNVNTKSAIVANFSLSITSFSFTGVPAYYSTSVQDIIYVPSTSIDFKYN